MRMLAKRIDALVTGVLLRVNELGQQSAFDEQGQRPVDSRARGEVAVPPHMDEQIFGLEMPVVGRGLLQNVQPFGCQAEAATFEIVFKLFKRVGWNCGFFVFHMWMWTPYLKLISVVIWAEVSLDKNHLATGRGEVMFHGQFIKSPKSCNLRFTQIEMDMLL